MQQNDNTAVDPHTVEPPNMSNTNTQNANPDSPSHKLLPAVEPKPDISGAVTGASNVSTHAGSGPPPTGEQQLKYENERLKMALAQR